MQNTAKQNVQLPLTTLGQETRWAYFTTLPSQLSECRNVAWFCKTRTIKNSDDMFSRFDAMPVSELRTRDMTEGQTSCATVCAIFILVAVSKQRLTHKPLHCIFNIQVGYTVIRYINSANITELTEETLRICPVTV